MTTRSRIDPGALQQIQLLYEDDHILCVNKPSGMAVHGGAGVTKRTVIDVLRSASEAKLELVHRLDQDTSGVLLLSKTASARASLSAVWDQVHKTYLAVVFGAFDEARTIDTPLKGSDGRLRSAKTRVRLERSIDGIGLPMSLVRVEIETGRTHQIRLHLQQIGHPVAMDDQHGDFKNNKALKRTLREAGAQPPKHLMLHAQGLVFDHPETGQNMRLDAPIPQRWRAVVESRGVTVDGGDEVP